MENTDKNVKLNFTLNTKQLYDFTMYNTYHGLFGIITIVVTIISVILLITGINEEGVIQKVVIALILFVFAFLMPYLLYKQADAHLKDAPIYGKDLQYEIGEEGIKVQMGDKTVESLWRQVNKVVETKKSFFIYTQHLGAFVLPKTYIGNEYDLLRKYIIRKVKNKHLK